MISRIRLEAFGATATDVERDLLGLAAKVSKLNVNGNTPSDLMPGEQVIQRELNEPDGCRTAFSGRLILHPNVAEEQATANPGLTVRSTGGDVRAEVGTSAA